MGLDIFPHILWRSSGVSFSEIEFNFFMYSILDREIEDLFRLQELSISQRDQICDNLFTEITDNKAAFIKILLNFKRNIYNNRNISQDKKEEVYKLLSFELKSQCDRYFDLISQIEKKKIIISDFYKEVYSKDIYSVKNICKDDDFLKGLILSSEQLFIYASKLQKIENKIDEGKIIGLWKYFTRSSTKCTPFSTFTQLNIGDISRNIETIIDIKELSPNLNSIIRFNNYILEIILNSIVNNKSIFKHLNICVNPTLRQNANNLLFFTNNNNTESFQTVKSNGIIEFIIDKIRSAKNLRVGELIDTLMPLIDNSQELDVAKYIHELTRTGLLFLDTGISGLDVDWAKALMNFIKENLMNEDIYFQACTVIEKLQKLKTEFTVAPSTNRENILRDIHSLFSELLILLQREEQNDDRNGTRDNYIKINDANNKVFLHKIPPTIDELVIKNVVYEDTTKDIHLAIDKSQITSIIEKINDIIHQFSCITYHENESKLYYDFHERTFSTQEEVSILEFYESLYKARNANTLTFTPNEINSKVAELNKTLKLEIEEIYRNGQIEFQNNELSFGYEFLDKLKPITSPAQSQISSSHSAFVHIFLKNDKYNSSHLKVVVSAIMPGKGKLISRFLHLFPQSVTNELKRWNINGKKNDTIYAENSDASFFNANLHPLLMPYEIELPGGNNRSKNNLINISNLIIRRNVETKMLELFHKNGKKVVVFDLGFQSLMGRSHLYRLLCGFSKNYGFPLGSVNNLLNSVFFETVNLSNGNAILVHPRIEFAGIVILQRKQWIIPKEVFNDIIVSDHQTELQFIAIQKWRKSLSIPVEVFIRIYHTEYYSQPINKDDYKPQYINFLSPISIRLFIKMVNKILKGKVVVEEMLPASEELTSTNNKKYTTEALLQWQ